MQNATDIRQLVRDAIDKAESATGWGFKTRWATGAKETDAHECTFVDHGVRRVFSVTPCPGTGLVSVEWPGEGRGPVAMTADPSLLAAHVVWTGMGYGE